VLSTAAVIGPDFDLDLLGVVMDMPEAKLLDALKEGVNASILGESGEVPRRFMFAHPLVRVTVYEDLDATRRARIHKRIAEALETNYGPDPGERLGTLARHWAAAVVSTDADMAIHTAKAIDYARRAVDRIRELERAR
jgi:hypothetical protein